MPPPRKRKMKDSNRCSSSSKPRGRRFRVSRPISLQKKYTAVLKEFDTPESGIFLYARAKDGSALLRQEVYFSSRKDSHYQGGSRDHISAKAQAGAGDNLGKNKDKVEYLALGLGQSPAKLQETFDLKYLGSENVNGVPCSVLNLKPKSASAGAFFSSITLWIKKSNGVPIQQKLQEPNGDYLLVVFSDEKLNPEDFLRTDSSRSCRPIRKSR